jgi:DNA-directed RNA polymerase specialized sigma24 family protein
MWSQRDTSTQSKPRPAHTHARHPKIIQRAVARDRGATGELVPTEMELTALARRCAIEGERFHRNQPHDPRFAYELFRRALVECDQAAWEHLYVQYRVLVDHWVRSSGAFASSGESSEFFVTAAYARFWRAISPERFGSFPTLATLLHYLQQCAACAVIDSARAQAWCEMLPQELASQDRAPQPSPEEQAIQRISRAEFWRYLNTKLHDEAERVVVLHSFVSGMKPSDIFKYRQDLFRSVNDVYVVKRNVLTRLSHDNGLRRILE